MNAENSNRIQRFAPPRLNLDEEFTTEQKQEFNRDVQKADRDSIAAKQTYKLQQQINAQYGSKPRYGKISGNDVVAHTARLQEKINKKRLGTLN